MPDGQAPREQTKNGSATAASSPTSCPINAGMPSGAVPAKLMRRECQLVAQPTLSIEDRFLALSGRSWRRSRMAAQGRFDPFLRRWRMTVIGAKRKYRKHRSCRIEAKPHGSLKIETFAASRAQGLMEASAKAAFSGAVGSYCADRSACVACSAGCLEANHSPPFSRLHTDAKAAIASSAARTPLSWAPWAVE
jgi:hypothetical protein